MCREKREKTGVHTRQARAQGLTEDRRSTAGKQIAGEEELAGEGEQIPENRERRGEKGLWLGLGLEAVF
jgi:hypothetical protein